jgi:hypothetical protein
VHHLRLIALALIAAVLPLESSRAADPQYPGEDAGVLIYSVGTLHIPMNFAFRYRRVASPSGGAASDWRGSIECRCVGFFRARRSNVDYDGPERGYVIVRRLPPGDYEVHDFGFSGSMGRAEVNWSSSRRFAIPFTIRTGEATYIGNFARAPSLGTPLQRTLGAAGFFVISDRSDRDIAIARQREPGLPPVRSSVFDVTTLGHPALLAHEPQ